MESATLEINLTSFVPTVEVCTDLQNNGIFTEPTLFSWSSLNGTYVLEFTSELANPIDSIPAPTVQEMASYLRGFTSTVFSFGWHNGQAYAEIENGSLISVGGVDLTDALVTLLTSMHNRNLVPTTSPVPTYPAV